MAVSAVLAAATPVNKVCILACSAGLRSIPAANSDNRLSMFTDSGLLALPNSV